MDANPDTTVVTPVTEKPRRFALNKQKALKIGAATAATVLGVVWLKRKLNGSCSVQADAHVETADSPDN